MAPSQKVYVVGVGMTKFIKPRGLRDYPGMLCAKACLVTPRTPRLLLCTLAGLVCNIHVAVDNVICTVLYCCCPKINAPAQGESEPNI